MLGQSCIIGAAVLLFGHSVKGMTNVSRLEEATGLVETPEQFEEDDLKGYKVKCLLQHRIAVASIIEINSKTAKGKYRVKDGSHSFDGKDFFTECRVI